MNSDNTPVRHSYSIERLVHFCCGKCRHWWAIGDVEELRGRFYCPSCGYAASVELAPELKP